MATNKMNDLYKDIDLRFTPHPVTGDVVRKSGIDAILQSIRHLVMTAEGEFVGELDIGGGTFKLLFKNNTPLLSYTLQNKISETIKNHGQKSTLRLLRALAAQQNVTLLCHCVDDAIECHRFLLAKEIARA